MKLLINLYISFVVLLFIHLYVNIIDVILDFGEGFADFRHFFAVVGKQFLIMVFAGFVSSIMRLMYL